MKIEEYHHDFVDRQTRDTLESMCGTDQLDDRLVRIYCTYKAWRDGGGSTGPLTRAEWAYFCQALGVAKFKLDEDSERYAFRVAAGTNQEDHDPGFVDALITQRCLYLALAQHNFDMSKWLEYQCALHGAVAVPPNVARLIADHKSRYDAVMQRQREREKAMAPVEVKAVAAADTNGTVPMNEDCVISHHGKRIGRFTGKDSDGKYVFVEHGTKREFRIRKPRLGFMED